MASVISAGESQSKTVISYSAATNTIFQPGDYCLIIGTWSEIGTTPTVGPDSGSNIYPTNMTGQTYIDGRQCLGIVAGLRPRLIAVLTRFTQYADNPSLGLTVSSGTGATQYAAQMYRIRLDPDEVFTSFTWSIGTDGTVANTGTSTTPLGYTEASPTGHPPIDTLVFGAHAFFAPETNWSAGDSDTTNGSWSTVGVIGNSGGGAASNITVAVQYKQVTAAGVQNYNGTLTNSRDWISSIYQMRITSGNRTLTANDAVMTIGGATGASTTSATSSTPDWSGYSSELVPGDVIIVQVAAAAASGASSPSTPSGWSSLDSGMMNNRLGWNAFVRRHAPGVGTSVNVPFNFTAASNAWQVTIWRYVESWGTSNGVSVNNFSNYNPSAMSVAAANEALLLNLLELGSDPGTWSVTGPSNMTTHFVGNGTTSGTVRNSIVRQYQTYVARGSNFDPSSFTTTGTLEGSYQPLYLYSSGAITPIPAATGAVTRMATAVQPGPVSTAYIAGSSSGGGGSGATFNVTLPSGWQVGDVALIQAMVVASTGSPDFSTVSGWDGWGGGSGGGTRYRGWSRVLQAGDSGPTITITGATAETQSWSCVVIRGGKQARGGSIESAVYGGSYTSLNFSNVTSTINDALLVRGWATTEATLTAGTNVGFSSGNTWTYVASTYTPGGSATKDALTGFASLSAPNAGLTPGGSISFTGQVTSLASQVFEQESTTAIQPITAATGVKVNTGTTWAGLRNTLVSNGDFESNTTGWTTDPTYATLSRTTDSAYSGSYSGWLFAQIASAPQALTYTTVSGLTVGKKYRASVWVKNMAGTADFRIEASPGGNGADINPDNTWQQAYVEFTATQTATNIGLVLRGTFGVGEGVMVDQVVVEEWGINPVPAASGTVTTIKYGNAGNLLANPGFETGGYPWAEWTATPSGSGAVTGSWGIGTFAGAQSARTIIGGTASSYARFDTPVAYKCEIDAGKPMYFSYYAKQDAGSTMNARVLLSLRNSGGGTVNDVYDVQAVTTTWTQYYLTPTPYTADATTAYALPGLYLNQSDNASNSGTVYWDNTHLSVNAPITPTPAGTLGAVTKPQTALNTLVSPTAAAAGTVTRSQTALNTLVDDTPAATSTVTKPQTALNTLVDDTPLAALGAVTKAQTATAVTTSPSPLATPAGTTKPQTATGVTLSPSPVTAGYVTDESAALTTLVDETPAAAGLVTDLGVGLNTTTSPTTAAAGVVTDLGTASTTSTPTTAATGVTTKPQTATGVTVAPTPAATPQALTKTTTATGVTVNPTPVIDAIVWETIYLQPDALLAVSGLTGTVTDIQDSPTSPDAAELAATGGPIDVRFSLEDPGYQLRTQAGDQIIRIRMTAV